jgi:hypothetical protein
MSPCVVATFTVTVPVVATLPLVGWATFFVAAPEPFVYVQSPLAAAADGVALGVGAAAGVLSFPPTCVTTITTAAMTTTTPRPAAMTRLRRLRAAAAS